MGEQLLLDTVCTPGKAGDPQELRWCWIAGGSCCVRELGRLDEESPDEARLSRPADARPSELPNVMHAWCMGALGAWDAAPHSSSPYAGPSGAES